jgi:hypothetical protein
MALLVLRIFGTSVVLCAAVVLSGAIGGCNTGSTCTDNGCPTDQACVDGHCRTPCQNDAACQSGEVCFRGYCELGDRRPNADGDVLSDDVGAENPDSGDPNSGDPDGSQTNTSDPGSTDCGNGMIDAGEACDGTALGSLTTCAAAGWRGGTIGCMATCVLHDLSNCTGAPGKCNGARVAGRQQCDGPALRGETCESLGFAGGTLSCTSECAYNVSGCTPP